MVQLPWQEGSRCPEVLEGGQRVFRRPLLEELGCGFRLVELPLSEDAAGMGCRWGRVIERRPVLHRII